MRVQYNTSIIVFGIIQEQVSYMNWWCVKINNQVFTSSLVADLETMLVGGGHGKNWFQWIDSDLYEFLLQCVQSSLLLCRRLLSLQTQLHLLNHRHKALCY